MSSNRNRAFTLMELLVVIAIIAILAAIIFPVFAQAREAARQTACISNCRQIGLAVTAYSQDFDEMLPCTWDGAVGPAKDSGTGGWMFFQDFQGPTTFDPTRGSLYSYVKNAGIFQCPSDPVRSGNSYAYNALLSTNTAILGFHAGLPLAAFTQPASTFLFVEEAAPEQNNSTNDGYFNVTTDRLSVRHHGGSVFIYCDGHAKHLASTSVHYPNPTGDNRFEP